MRGKGRGRQGKREGQTGGRGRTGGEDTVNGGEISPPWSFLKVGAHATNGNCSPYDRLSISPSRPRLRLDLFVLVGGVMMICLTEARQ